ncbi:glucosamine inositolphosphorylceramide transferase family protein [Halobacillus aidingensis]|uniref:Glucosamine inositolphosphorylceramide transferase 1 N-terminal domain-containing protein n=1 Tax=Halobacillus aidingensis TaxID=240303 RepID=A0A1H0H7P8_HALAD|nr:hypothetical protein [Halobacillus aidingensis]SDO15168.1 hypothetical protein SAMN05421677_10382 [Halobacillus aidingensis]
MKVENMKFGIIIDELSGEKWKYETLHKLKEMEGLECSLIIKVHAGEKNQSYKSQDHNIKDLFPHCSYKICEVDKGVLKPRDLLHLRAYHLDFYLDLSDVRFEGEFLNLPLYGVWSFRHLKERGPILHELWKESSYTEVFFDRLLPNGKVQNLIKGSLPTILFSAKKHKGQIEQAILEWPAQMCRKINKGIPYTFGSHECVIEKNTPVSVMKRIRYSLRIGKHQAKRWYKRLFGYEYWNIGIVKQPLQDFLSENPLEIEWLFPDKKLYYADPFAYEADGELRLIFEEVDHRVVKGFISECHLMNEGEDKGKYILRKGTMNLPTHMSYPYIVEDGNHYYCIPETSESKKVTLHQWDDETKEWREVKTILKGVAAVDSTIIHWNGRWWLFCTRASSLQTENYELHIFYSDHLLGAWKEHAANPVKYDIRSARPAGTPFVRNDVLYRPAQDCSATYGGSIVLNRVEELSPDKFQEEPVSHLKQPPGSLYPDGLHTMSYARENISLVDGKRIDYHPLNLIKKLYMLKSKPFEKVMKPSNRKGIFVHSFSIKNLNS